MLEGLGHCQPQNDYRWQGCRRYLGRRSSYRGTCSTAWASVTRILEKSEYELGLLG